MSLTDAPSRSNSWTSEFRQPRNSAAEVKGSIHDDATASKLGFRGGTVAGSIHMDLGNGAKFNLVADTGSGSVNVSQPISMQGSLNRHHISGTVNGGGPTIHANTGSGDISIR